MSDKEQPAAGRSPEWVARVQMSRDHSTPGPGQATSSHGERELVQLRESCWRMTHEIHSLNATIDELRRGANSLAVDNALLRIEIDALRRPAPSARSRRR